MAGGYSDGAVIIDTAINNTGTFKGAREWNRAVKQMKDTADRTGRDMQRSSAAYTKSVQDNARAVRDLDNQIEQLQKRQVEVIREMNALQKSGTGKERFQTLSEEAKKIAAQVQTLRAERNELDAVGRGFGNVAQESGRAAESVRRVGTAGRSADASLARVVSGGALRFLRRLAAGAKNAFIQLAKLPGRAVSKGLKTIGTLATRAGKALFGLRRNAKQAGGGFNLSLRNILKYGLGIRSLFVLFNRLRNAIKEGFSALMVSDARVKASLGSLSAALNGLKGSMTAAFAPILTAIAPALTTLINMLATATNYVGMFLAALTGQSYYMAAKGISAVGSAASGAAGSVQDLKRQLAGFDELNILSAGNSSGGGGGGNGASVASYTQIPIDSGIAAFVERLRGLFEAGEYNKIGGIIAEGINGAFARVQALIKWESIGGVVTKYVDALDGIFNGLVDRIDWPNIGRTFADGINSISYALNHAFDVVDLAGLGKGIGEALSGLVSRVDFGSVGTTLANLLTAKLTVVGNALARFDWAQFGPKLAEGVNKFFKRIDEAVGGIDWPGIARKMAFGINGFIRHIEWRELGDTLAKRIASMLNAAKEALTTFSWSGAAANFAKALNAFFRRKDLWTAAGDTINAALRGMLDFAQNFVVNFDEIAAANAIRAALGRIDWSGIASSFWSTAKNAFSKAGNFVKVLLGGDVYDVAGDAVDQMWERGSGNASSKSYSVSWVSTLATSIGKALASIPWKKLFDEVKKAAGEAISGLVDGLFGTEDGLFLVKLTAAFAALQLLIPRKISALGTIITGALQLLKNGMALELAGIAAAATSAISNIEQLYKTIDEYQKEGYGNVWDQFVGGLEIFYGENGLGFVEHMRQSINALFAPLGLENVGDKVMKTIGADTGTGGKSGAVTPKVQLQPYDERYPKTYTTYGEWKAQQEANTHAIEENTEAVERGQWENYYDQPSPYELAMQGYYKGSGLEDVGNTGLFGKIGEYLSTLFGGKNGTPKVQLKPFDEWEKEQNKNTEAVKENTEAVEDWMTQGLLLNAWGMSVADISEKLGLDEKQTTKLRKATLNMKSPGVTAEVDFVPNVPNGEHYKNNGLLKWLQTVFAPGTDTEARVELIQQGWRTVAAWVEKLTGGNVDKGIGLLRMGWQTVASFVQALTGGGVEKAIGLIRGGWQTVATFVQALMGGDVNKAVGIIRDKWQTVAGWITSLYMGGNVSKGVGVNRDGFTTIENWIKSLFMGGSVSKGVGVMRDGFTTVAAWLLSLFMGGSVSKGVGVIRDGFTTIADWIKSLFMGGNVSKGVGVMRDGFTTLAAWISALYMGGNVSKGVGVMRDGFTTIADWIKLLFMGGSVLKGVGVMRDGFTTLADWIKRLFMGGSVEKGIGLMRDGFETVAGWIRYLYMGGAIAQLVGLQKWDWTWVDTWAKQWAQTPIAQLVGLDKWDWTWVDTWAKKWATSPIAQLVQLGKYDWTWVDTWAQQWAQTPITQYVNLAIGKVATGLKNALALLGITVATGGVISPGGNLARFASGGVIRGGAAKWWNSIPKYAAGTSRARGTMFVAGEAGPEIVGHINGRTEILNKSQLAQTMYGAVTSGMMAALKGIEFKVPAMATGSVMPYEVSAQIAKSTADLQGTLDANNEDLIQTIISVIGQQTAAIVAALQAQTRQGAGGLNAQQVINEINRRTLMGLQPLRGI